MTPIIYNGKEAFFIREVGDNQSLIFSYLGKQSLIVPSDDIELHVALYFLDNDPKIVADYLCDQHLQVVPMQMCQLLATCHKQICPVRKLPPEYVHEESFSWAVGSVQNYEWVVDYTEHTIFCWSEMTGLSCTQHSLYNVINWFRNNLPSLFSGGLRPFPDPDEQFCLGLDTVENWRNYYSESKSFFATWQNREKPDWM